MRIGVNPQKSENKIALATHHRVVVVVYIPNQEGFYKDSFQVFRSCLDSLVATTSTTAAITIVDNGSHQGISDLLNSYLKDEKIDTLITHHKNIGKIDALIGAARGAREQYITLSDSDILFVKGWQESVEDVFANFKDAGSVSPIPIKNGILHGTASVLLQILLKKIKFRYTSIPENFISYNRYLESINWHKESTDDGKWPVIEKGGYKAIIGSGHQVLTIKRNILFKTVPTKPSLTLVGSNSEHHYVDDPIDMAGCLRLATYHNFAYHMGNKVEPWMEIVERENKQFPKSAGSVKPDLNPDLQTPIWKKKIYIHKKYYIRKLFKKVYGIR